MKKTILLTILLAFTSTIAYSQTKPTAGQSRPAPVPAASPQPTGVQQRQPASFNISEYGVSFQTEPRLIIMMAALDAAGFDPTPSGVNLQSSARKSEKISPTWIRICAAVYAHFTNATSCRLRPLLPIRQRAMFRSPSLLVHRPRWRRRNVLKSCPPACLKCSTSRRSCASSTAARGFRKVWSVTPERTNQKAIGCACLQRRWCARCSRICTPVRSQFPRSVCASSRQPPVRRSLLKQHIRLVIGSDTFLSFLICSGLRVRLTSG